MIHSNEIHYDAGNTYRRVSASIYQQLHEEATFFVNVCDFQYYLTNIWSQLMTDKL
jgi:hypothetical protein